ncbi:ABC transporter permease [bacterium]|nr:MAG: ABC transporter permease [bacterium]
MNKYMPRYFNIEKVALFSSVVGASSLFTFGFVIFRPNRLVSGESVSLFEALDPYLSGTVVLFWVLLLMFSILRIPERTRTMLFGLLSCIIIPLLLAGAGYYAAKTAVEAGPVARVALGPGFWAAAFALIVVFTDITQRLRERRFVLILLAVISFGTIMWLFLSGKLDDLSLMREFSNRRSRFTDELRTHLMLAFSAVGAAAFIGIPLGILAHRKTALRTPTFFTLNTLQTLPSLALFGILIPVLSALTFRFPALKDVGIRGIGTAPAIIALTVYSLLPVARNTYAGFAAVDPSAVDAGRGMGMTNLQLMWKIEAPIASPIILNGIRVALVQAVGLTAVAALIGAGGFGVFIFQGLGQAATDLILLGAVPTIVIAVLADAIMNGIIAIASPKGLR